MANNIIADNKTHEYLVALGFYKNGTLNPTIAPMWWQIKIWMWEEHQAHTSLLRDYVSLRYHAFSNYKDNKCMSVSKDTFDSPITVEIEAIKFTIKNLYLI